MRLHAVFGSCSFFRFRTSPSPRPTDLNLKQYELCLKKLPLHLRGFRSLLAPRKSDHAAASAEDFHTLASTKGICSLGSFMYIVPKAFKAQLFQFQPGLSFVLHASHTPQQNKLNLGSPFPSQNFFVLSYFQAVAMASWAIDLREEAALPRSFRRAYAKSHGAYIPEDHGFRICWAGSDPPAKPPPLLSREGERASWAAAF